MKIRTRIKSPVILAAILMLATPLHSKAQQLDEASARLNWTVISSQTQPQKDSLSSVRYVIREVGLPDSANVNSASKVARYGYDLVDVSKGDVERLRVRGGLSKLSPNAHFGVQLIVNW
ncbi:MAG: hypothetical protein J5J00_11315 [Deltaproteobacteria bacterium]|nr:hypothetical protein [Deltaproteobacteria bacterium]